MTPPLAVLHATPVTLDAENEVRGLTIVHREPVTPVLCIVVVEIDGRYALYESRRGEFGWRGCLWTGEDAGTRWHGAVMGATARAMALRGEGR